MRSRLAAAVFLPLAAVALTGCGLFGPEAYEVDERSIEVDAGDEFALSVPANPAMAQDFYLVSPHPDSAVVRRTGEVEETEAGDPGVDGGGDGTRTFEFKAVKAGTTKIKLIHCPLKSCFPTRDNPDALPTAAPTRPVPTATSSPGTNPEYFIYTVTVR
ncbi:protease inhibitor I42 family protein [Streptomyces monticola]|uniref:Protease inhibitor I42 family protein n=1 Tax=Streptomyces monticola TaxID=2666263 RepID=A0ABW2JVM5_9ACTN